MHKVFSAPAFPTLVTVLLVLGSSVSAKADPHFGSCSERTGNNATLIVPASVVDINGAALEADDELALFTPSGVCAGRLVWDGANAALAVWEDDPMTEAVEGFIAGDPMTYAVWDASEAVEYGRDLGSIFVTYDDEHTASEVYEPEAIYQASSISVAVPVTAEEASPSVFALEGNFPNPFHASTTIRYQLPEPSRVTIEVYSLLGHRVGVLVDESRPAGTHEVEFLASSDLASGVYVYRLQAGEHTSHRKMTLVN